MIVHVVVLDPQGSAGGFDWFRDDRAAALCLARWKRERVPVLGVVPAHVHEDLSDEEITRVIDSQLPALERGLGYVSPDSSREISSGPRSMRRTSS